MFQCWGKITYCLFEGGDSVVGPLFVVAPNHCVWGFVACSRFAIVALLKFFKRHVLTNHMSNWWEALGQYEDSEFIQSFCSCYPDGHNGNNFKILQT